ncbi:MAG TPA: 7TM domain-containing protein [Gemmataceae bacterium]|nr:7TM domain-containing protein [Gemmataceae bacterium]
MSRTTLCAATAAVLALLSLGVMALRHHVMGDEVKVPHGPGTWKVAMVVQGRSEGDAKLLTLTPLDFGRQHVVRESCQSAEFLDAAPETRHDKAPEGRHPERRRVLWKKRVGAGDGPFRLRYEFYCTVDSHRASAPMSDLAKALSAPPKPGQDLDVARRSDPDPVSDLARQLTAGLDQPLEQAEALFRHVDREIANEPSLGGPALQPVDCLKAGAGASASKARLLVALLRHRSIPARLVTGVTLTRGLDQHAHNWVEAWLDQRWLPMCPVHHRFGEVPPTYLVFTCGDTPVVVGHHVSDLNHAFLVEKVGPEGAAADAGPLRRAFLAVSLWVLSPNDQELVRFLLLLPVAALIVCLFRNVIGLASFGTFAPALLGLAFREFHSMPGLLVFVAIVLVGWLMRRLLNHYHLLQVPRTAFMLSLIVVVLIGLTMLANYRSLSATRYVAIFPMVILTGMIERFWTLETEDGTSSSFRTLVTTMIIAATIALVLSFHAVVNHLFCFPETVGLIMAAQLLLGRYTGYRLSELFRFRDFLGRRPGLRIVGTED